MNRHRPYRRSGTLRIGAWPWASHRSTTDAGRCRWSLMPVQTTTMGAGHEHPWWPCVWQRRADAGVVARDVDPTWLLLQRARDGVYALCGEVVATAVRCRTSTTPTTACSTATRPRGAPDTTRPATPPSARQEVACRMPHSLRWAVIRLAGLVAASLPHPDNDRAFEHITVHRQAERDEPVRFAAGDRGATAEPTVAGLASPAIRVRPAPERGPR